MRTFKIAVLTTAACLVCGGCADRKIDWRGMKIDASSEEKLILSLEKFAESMPAEEYRRLLEDCGVACIRISGNSWGMRGNVSDIDGKTPVEVKEMADAVREKMEERKAEIAERKRTRLHALRSAKRERLKELIADASAEMANIDRAIVMCTDTDARTGTVSVSGARVGKTGGNGDRKVSISFTVRNLTAEDISGVHCYAVLRSGGEILAADKFFQFLGAALKPRRETRVDVDMALWRDVDVPGGCTLIVTPLSAMNTQEKIIGLDMAGGWKIEKALCRRRLSMLLESLRKLQQGT